MILWTHSVAITVERFHRSLDSNQNCIWTNRNKSKNHRFLSHLTSIQTDTKHKQRKYFLHYMPTIRAKTIKNRKIQRAAVCIYKMCKLSENVANQICIPRCFASWHSACSEFCTIFVMRDVFVRCFNAHSTLNKWVICAEHKMKRFVHLSWWWGCVVNVW